MNNLLILCIDDEREVLDSVLNDLAEFEQHFIIEAAQSVDEARQIIAESPDHKLALVLCDHIMPKELGVDFLIELNQDARTAISKKVLLTGQAGLEDTVQAINQANLDYYIAKPWKKTDLVEIVTDQLSNFVIENNENLLKWLQILDTEKLMNAMNKKRFEFSDN